MAVKTRSRQLYTTTIEATRRLWQKVDKSIFPDSS